MGYFARKPPRTLVLANGVSDEWLDQLFKIDVSPQTSEPTVVYVGLLGFNHALSTLIEAAELVPEAQFIIAGEGPERSALEDLASSLRLKNVTFTGFLNQEALLAIYQKAHVLVSHVRSNPLYEWTQPAKLWEYMATGRPVVHAGQGEVMPILEQHNLALTVLPAHPEALAQAIKELLANPAKGRAIAENARFFVSQHRRRSKLFDQFNHLLESTLNQ